MTRKKKNARVAEGVRMEAGINVRRHHLGSGSHAFHEIHITNTLEQEATVQIISSCNPPLRYTGRPNEQLWKTGP